MDPLKISMQGLSDIQKMSVMFDFPRLAFVF